MSINTARWLLALARQRWAQVALAVTAIIAGVLVIRAYHNAAEEARQEALQAQRDAKVLESARDADAAAVATREASRDTIRIEEETNRENTDEALAANPEWADQPVPPDIVRSLLD